MYYFQQARFVQQARITFTSTIIRACLKQLAGKVEKSLHRILYLPETAVLLCNKNSVRTIQIVIFGIIPVFILPVNAILRFNFAILRHKVALQIS